MRIQSPLAAIMLSSFLLTPGGLAVAAQPVLGLANSPDEVPISYRVAGKGNTALVFVHGWSCDGRYWDAQMNHFAKDYQVVSVDLAGHGGSGLSRERYTMPAFGADVVAVIEKLDLQRIVLIGHSMGGPVITEAASRVPERVIGLVAVDSFQTGAQWPKGEEISQFMEPFEKDFRQAAREFVRGMFTPNADPALVEWISNDMASAPPEVAVSAMRELFLWMDHDMQETMNAVKAPLRHINADPQGNQQAKTDVTFIQGAGHFIPQVQPAKFNEALEAILETVN